RAIGRPPVAPPTGRKGLYGRWATGETFDTRPTNPLRWVNSRPSPDGAILQAPRLPTGESQHAPRGLLRLPCAGRHPHSGPPDRDRDGALRVHPPRPPAGRDRAELSEPLPG